VNASPVSLIHQTYSVIQNPAEGIKQLASSSDISTMRSSLIVTCRPDKVWTAPIPGGLDAERHLPRDSFPPIEEIARFPRRDLGGCLFSPFEVSSHSAKSTSGSSALTIMPPAF
jgi:hypothetical protein